MSRPLRSSGGSLALAEAAAPELVAPGQVTWMDRLDLELDNLRAAIAYTLKHADPAPGIRLAAALRVFWKARGHAAEGAEALRALLDVPAAQEAAVLRARGLATAAYLLEQTGGYAIAEGYCDEALSIAQAAGDDYLVADLMDVRGYILLRRGRPGAAMPLIELGLGLARQIGEAHLTARLLAARAFALDLEGDRAGAARDAAESLRLYRQVGDQRQVGTMLGNLGYVELSIGDIDIARGHCGGGTVGRGIPAVRSRRHVRLTQCRVRKTDRSRRARLAWACERADQGGPPGFSLGRRSGGTP